MDEPDQGCQFVHFHHIFSNFFGDFILKIKKKDNFQDISEMSVFLFWKIEKKLFFKAYFWYKKVAALVKFLML